MEDAGKTTGTDAEVLYGPQTVCALESFGQGRRCFEDVPALVRNYALIKAAAAKANAEMGIIEAPIAEAIEKAAAEVAEGRHDEQFPTALLLGGGGTSTNMNVNEVLAARATQIAGTPVHPNNHVNESQSTNDTHPTAMALTIRELAARPLAAVDHLIEALDAKGKEYEETKRLGRTCLQDAVTLTVGETHGSYVAALKRTRAALATAVEQLREVPLGATVLGTGSGAPEGFKARAVAALRDLTGTDVVEAPDLFDVLSNLDPYADIAQAGARIALTMAKIAQDFRFLSSGPIGGISELTLPKTQAGSSIMPAKVNPVIPEFVMRLSYRVRGASHTVEMAVAAGELELNIMEPVVVDSLLDIFEDLTASAQVFADKCVAGMAWNGSRLESNLRGGFDQWVELSHEKGYDFAADQVRSFRADVEHHSES